MAVLSFSAGISRASCQLPSIETKFHQSDAVFVGKVLSIDPVDPARESSDKHGIPRLEFGPDYGIRVTFEVQARWKGPEKTRLHVWTGYGPEDYGQHFVEAHRYLVFAEYSKPGDRLMTHAFCIAGAITSTCSIAYEPRIGEPVWIRPGLSFPDSFNDDEEPFPLLDCIEKPILISPFNLDWPAELLCVPVHMVVDSRGEVTTFEVAWEDYWRSCFPSLGFGNDTPVPAPPSDFLQTLQKVGLQWKFKPARLGRKPVSVKLLWLSPDHPSLVDSFLGDISGEGALGSSSQMRFPLE